MVNLIVRVMFCTLIIDITIGFMWVGLLGYIELRDTYWRAFPTGAKSVNYIAGLINKLKGATYGSKATAKHK